ncbi:MAG: type II secretion system major pseudopilin GspG [Phycisphaeraceae bacterium]|nr:type II secretion system major pseudopilin GspG [Phycisphaeraceae bacterium]
MPAPLSSARTPLRTTALRRGFTLLEMMLVVVIIGLLATVVIYNIAGQSTAALEGVTKTRIAQIKSALDQYYSRNGDYPSSGQLLLLTQGSAPILEKIPTDGWKRPFIYLKPGQEQGKDYSLYSAGKDGQPGTNDDVNVWFLDKE